MVGMHVLSISGSLRKGSYNTALLRAASELLPKGMTLQVLDISSIPLYDDEMRTLGFPKPVKESRDRAAAARALLIATAEYNFPIPDVFKNAIDEASHPPDPLFDRKRLLELARTLNGVS